MARNVVLLALVSVTVGVGSAQAQSYTINPNAPIVDNDPSYTCFPINVPDAGVVTSVSVAISMSHTWIGDVRIQLRSPAGSALTVLQKPGTPGFPGAVGDNSNLDASFPLTYVDGAASNAETMGNTLTDAQAVCRDDGRCQYSPNSDSDPSSTLVNFAGFSGESRSGSWQICFADTGSGDTGVVSSVTLFVGATCVGLSEGFDNTTLLPAAGWVAINRSSPLGAGTWAQGNQSNFTAQSGAPNSYIAAGFDSGSGIATISNWLLLPNQTMRNGDVLTFYTRTIAGSTFPDRLQVRLSLNGTSTNVGSAATEVGDFTTLLLDLNPTYAVGGYPNLAWSRFDLPLSGLAGPTSGRLAFRHFVQNGGPDGSNSNYVGIDTLSVQTTCPTAADLAITKTDGQATAVPGTPVTYSIVASNAGPSAATGATVADTLPGTITGAAWTCVGAGGGTCTASGSGHINDTVNLPVGATVTYTLTGTISPTATGSLSNTATVAVPGGVADPVPGNNSATDTDALTPQADLSITKTEPFIAVKPGQTLTYTIVASNAGPSAATGASITDTVPATLTGATWTCTGSGGGVCPAGGSGDISHTVDVPPGGSVHYQLSATVDAAATGTITNTASIAPPGGVTDPSPGNNSASDADTVTTCGAEEVIVPDGRLTLTGTVPGAISWYGASVRIGNSYSVEIKTRFVPTPLGSLTVYSGDDGCSGTSTLPTVHTEEVDPAADSTMIVRQSFTAPGTATYFRARLVHGSGTMSYTVSWSDTTMFSPAWSDNGSFDTFYSFQNTTGAILHGSLTLLSPSGALVISHNMTIAPGQTVSTNTATLGIARNQTGTARFTHDGPPGAILAEAAIARFSVSPAYVQPVKFQPVRETR